MTPGSVLMRQQMHQFIHGPGHLPRRRRRRRRLQLPRHCHHRAQLRLRPVLCLLLARLHRLLTCQQKRHQRHHQPCLSRYLAAVGAPLALSWCNSAVKQLSNPSSIPRIPPTSRSPHPSHSPTASHFGRYRLRPGLRDTLGASITSVAVSLPLQVRSALTLWWRHRGGIGCR